MSPAISDIQTLKYMGVAGLSFYVIQKLFALVMILVSKKKESKENEAEKILKEDSRKKINCTHTYAEAINKQISHSKEHFYEMKNQVDNIHDVITEKKEGVPLVYNKDLEKSIDRLNNTITNLACAIKDLSKNK